MAVRWGDARTAALLRERGADPTSVTPDDRTLAPIIGGESAMDHAIAGLEDMLAVAVAAGDILTVRRLLDAGASVDETADAKRSPLGEACWRGRPEVVRELVGGPYAAIVRILLAAGSPVPETLWEDAPGPLTMLAELGVSLG